MFLVWENQLYLSKLLFKNFLILTFVHLGFLNNKKEKII